MTKRTRKTDPKLFKTLDSFMEKINTVHETIERVNKKNIIVENGLRERIASERKEHDDNIKRIEEKLRLEKEISKLKDEKEVLEAKKLKSDEKKQKKKEEKNEEKITVEGVIADSIQEETLHDTIMDHKNDEGYFE